MIDLENGNHLWNFPKTKSIPDNQNHINLVTFTSADSKQQRTVNQNVYVCTKTHARNQSTPMTQTQHATDAQQRERKKHPVHETRVHVQMAHMASLQAFAVGQVKQKAGDAGFYCLGFN